MRHPDRDDDVRPAVVDRAIGQTALTGAGRPVAGRLLEQTGVPPTAVVGPRVEVGLAFRNRDRLVAPAGDGPTGRGAPDQPLDVPVSSLPAVVAHAKGDRSRLYGRRREKGRGQRRGARERCDERAAHRGRLNMYVVYPRDGPGWWPGPRRAHAGMRGRLAVGRGCWITSSGRTPCDLTALPDAGSLPAHTARVNHPWTWMKDGQGGGRGADPNVRSRPNDRTSAHRRSS